MISGVRLRGSSSTCATQVIKGLNKIFLEAVVQYVLLEWNPDDFPLILVERTWGYDEDACLSILPWKKTLASSETDLAQLQTSIKIIFSYFFEKKN